MVSPFMAFARGALEGYNEIQAQKRANEAELAKQTLVNDGKAKVKEDPKFTILDSAGTVHTYFDLGSGGEIRERDDHNFNNFLTNKKLTDDINKWKTTDLTAYNNAQNKFANLSQLFLGHRRKYNEKEGRYISVNASVAQGHKNHPFSEMFVNIADGMAPNTNADSIIKHYTDNSGKEFWEIEQFDEEAYGYENVNALYTDAYELMRTKRDSGRTLNHYVTTFKPPMWKGYQATKDIFRNMRANSGRLGAGDIDELQGRLNGVFFFKDMGGVEGPHTEKKINNAPFDANKMHELITMSSSVNHKVNKDAFHYYSITSARDLAKELGIGDTSVFGERARAAKDSLDTIKKLGQLYNEGGESALMGTFVGGGTSLLYSIFGSKGTIDQLGDLLDGFNTKYGTKTEGGLLEKMKGRMRDNSIGGAVENYSRRQVLQELLAYQMAAAIQGGTGGRTISDQDVKRISAALGNTVFANKDINMARLDELAGVMDNISKVSTYYGTATNVESLKGAHAMAMFSYGIGLDKVGSTWMDQKLGQMLDQQGKYVPSNQEIRQSTDQKYYTTDKMVIRIPGDNPITFELEANSDLTKNETFNNLTEVQKNQALRQFNINSRNQ